MFLLYSFDVAKTTAEVHRSRIDKVICFLLIVIVFYTHVYFLFLNILISVAGNSSFSSLSTRGLNRLYGAYLGEITAI